MKCIGLDLGSKTLGIAISDREGIIASSYKTITFSENDYDSVIPQIEDIIKTQNIDKVVLGLPKNMNNSLGERALKTIEFKEKLEAVLKSDVILEDERWTTIQANNLLINADLSRKKRKKVVDKLAATFILQSYLDRKK